MRSLVIKPECNRYGQNIIFIYTLYFNYSVLYGRVAKLCCVCIHGPTRIVQIYSFNSTYTYCKKFSIFDHSVILYPREW
jgi:hypothetical protein